MGQPVSVLVIDDSVTIRAMMARVLQEDRSLTVTTARSADEAEQLMRRQRFDVITLDVEMPDVNGLDYLQRLVELRDIPVVMLSASTGSGAAVRAKAFRLGAVGCFDKADAVRQAATLIRLVKNAAAGKARIDRADREAMADDDDQPGSA